MVWTGTARVFSGLRPGAPRIRPRPRRPGYPAVAGYPARGAGVDGLAPGTATGLLGLEFLGVRHQTDQAERSQAGEAGEDPGQVHAGEHSDERGRDRHTAQAAQQRGAAPSRLLAADRGQRHADLAAGMQVRADRALRPARSARRRHRRRRLPPRPPSVAGAPTSVATNRRRDPRRFRPTDRRATPCAVGRPEPRSWARHARAAAIDDGSGRWTRPPDAHQIAAKRSGRAPPPREALREPAGSQSSLPDDLPLLRLKTLMSQCLQVVDGGEMPQRRPRRHFSCPFGCTLSDPLNQGPLSGAAPRPLPARQTARLHQRPSVHPTVTASPKQSETRAEVTTSDSGPDATSAPLETRAPWVKPGGISSQ